MSRPTRSDYIAGRSWEPTGNFDGPYPTDDAPRCGTCEDKGRDPNHEEDECPNVSGCCGAELDDTRLGTCPRCGEHC